ncbi:glutathione S-transferase [Bradyrhizobium embrapense]
MIKLYHIGESTCSQRVRLALAEKRLDWESVLMTGSELRSTHYLALNPSGVVPTLDHDGHLIVESRIICEYLEEAFPEHSLMPARALDRQRVRRWTKSYDDSLHLAIFVLSFMCWMRERYLNMPQEGLQSCLPGLADPVKRRVSYDLLEKGWKSESVAVSLQRLVTLIAEVNLAAGENRWLVGDKYSLADIDMLIVVQRLSDLGLSELWDEHAALSVWLDRARGRASFEEAFTPWRSDDVIAANRTRAKANASHFSEVISSIGGSLAARPSPANVVA